MLLERPGIHLHYEVAGAGPAVLVTHGFGASSAMWARTVPALAATHTVVTYDQRGHGASDYPRDPDAYSIRHALGDIAGLLDAVGAERAVLMGHSLGGYLSLAFHVAHPERVAGLVLVGTGPGFRSDDARSHWNDMAERYAKDLDKHGLAGLPTSEELDPGVHRDAVGLAMSARGVLTQHDASVIDSLPAIAVPTLVVVGSVDAPFLDGSRYMAAKIPHAELVVIDGAGHAPNITHPTAFASAVLGFLNDRGL
jgi:pimeloyl-ACP methyl ester carboxylesterase